MWKAFFETVRRLLRLSDEVYTNRAEIKKLREDLAELIIVVERLSGQVAHVGEREERERAMLLLQLENTLLRGRQAPVAGETDAAA